MSVESLVKNRIEELLNQAQSLRHGSQRGQTRGEEHRQQCNGWMAAASNIIQILVPDKSAGYRRLSDKILEQDYGYVAHRGVGEIAEILNNLLRDAESGLVASVADHARAEVFDDFLDHAKAYRKSGRKNEAGVIAGVVFEDSIRQVCRKRGITEKGRKLDGLISELGNQGVLSGTKAKRARVTADVRTKATHAQWDEFDDSDLKTAIEFTEEFISKHIEEQG